MMTGEQGTSRKRGLFISGHIRNANTIKSTFATLRLRNVKTGGSLNRATILTIVFKFGLSAEKGLRKLRGFKRLAGIINGVKFMVGIMKLANFKGAPLIMST